MKSPHETHTSAARVLTLVLSIAAGVLAGCGGSASLQVSSKAAKATPAQSSPDAPQGQQRAGGQQGTRPAQGAPGVGPRLLRIGAPRVQTASAPGAAASDEQRVGSPKGPDPCRLVSLAEAQAFAGPVIGRIDAPLGPTCIYKLPGNAGDITLSVQSISLVSITRQMKQAGQVTVAGRTAYCGTLGRPMLFAPVSSGRVLSVTAPCSVAARFAAVALPRL